MIKLPCGVDINNLIHDIRIISWQAADILLYYSKLLEDSDDKKNILKNNDEDDPVTLADLKVNEIINKRINQKYRNIKWDIIEDNEIYPL
jgi:3'(2'), 5'-bisphosphate nucleotidase